jgi:hypothetical protein
VSTQGPRGAHTRATTTGDMHRPERSCCGKQGSAGGVNWRTCCLARHTRPPCMQGVGRQAPARAGGHGARNHAGVTCQVHAPTSSHLSARTLRCC